MKKKLIALCATLIAFAETASLLCRKHIDPKKETIGQIFEKTKKTLKEDTSEYDAYLGKVMFYLMGKTLRSATARKRAKQ